MTKLTSIYSILAVWAIMILTSNQALSNTSEYKNVNGYTLDENGDLIKFSRFIVNNDEIVEVFTESDETSASQYKIDQSIDLQGKTVLPGLIDAHGHILGLGAGLVEVDLRGTKSELEAVNRVQQFVQNQHKKEEVNWIIGDGWNQVLWPSKQFPSKESLDKAFPNTPVLLSRIDGHAAWVNSKALELAGITRQTISPSGGEIVKNEKGEPSGLLIDNAEDLVQKVIPKPNKEQLYQYLNLATDHLLELGITSAHDAGISKQVKDFYIEHAKKRDLRMRIYAMLSATDPNIMDMLKAGHYYDEQGFLHIRSVKAYGDGALGSRGAALLKPYSDDPDNSGLLVTPEERLPTLFNTVIGANFQLNFHAIGDRANRLALQQFKRSFEMFSDNASRHRIEHAQVVAVEDIPLFKEYGVIPSMQPTHATSDMNMAEDRIGKTRLKGAYAWQTFLKQGSRIALGSDFPVELANPFHGLHAAVTRQNAEGMPKQGWIQSERLTRIQALKGFTLDAAYAAFQEQMIGTLSTGKKADFIVIDKDYFEIPAADIRNIKVLQTYVNGKLQFSQ